MNNSLFKFTNKKSHYKLSLLATTCISIIYVNSVMANNNDPNNNYYKCSTISDDKKNCSITVNASTTPLAWDSIKDKVKYLKEDNYVTIKNIKLNINDNLDYSNMFKQGFSILDFDVKDNNNPTSYSLSLIGASNATGTKYTISGNNKEGNATNNRAFSFNNITVDEITNLKFDGFKYTEDDISVISINAGAILNKITNSEFSNNISAGNGGGMYVDKFNGKLTDVTFTNNTSEKGNGGGLYIANLEGAQDGSFNNVTFKNNTAAKNGGGLYINNFNDGDDKAFNNVTFKNNTASGSGGGLYAKTSSIVSLSNMNFNANSAGHGGAMYLNVNDANNTILLTNNLFKDNKAAGVTDNQGFKYSKGGAVYLKTSTTNTVTHTISDNTFISNNAEFSGGAIFIDGKFNADIENNYFINNKATDDDGEGGAIAINADVGSSAKIHNNTFIGNKAKLGGAVFFEKSSSVLIDNYFIANHANDGGGAIYLFNDYENTANDKHINLAITATTGNKAIFYGNTVNVNAAGDKKYQAIYAVPSQTAGNKNSLTFDVAAGSKILMFDPFAGFATVNKTGAGLLALGGHNTGLLALYGQNINEAASWNITAGILQLTDVTYNTNENATTAIKADAFNVTNATLQGSGTITANTVSFDNAIINLQGFKNTGNTVDQITNLPYTKADEFEAIKNAIKAIDTTAVEGQSTLNIAFNDGDNRNLTIKDTTINVHLKSTTDGQDEKGKDKYKYTSDSLLRVTGKGNVTFAGNNKIKITGIDFTDFMNVAATDDDVQLKRIATVIDVSGVTGDKNGKGNIKVVLGDNKNNSFSGYAQIHGLWDARLDEGNQDKYGVGINLSWYSLKGFGAGGGPKQAHGNFDIATGNEFTINGVLQDRTEDFSTGSAFNWDGKSLHKKGAGKLILDGVNTYTGNTTLEAGTLIVGSKDDKSSAQIVSDLTIDGDGVIGGFGKFGNVTVSTNKSLSIDGAYSKTVNVNSLTFLPNSTYKVKLYSLEDNENDKIIAANNIAIGNGVNLAVTFGKNWANASDLNKSYTILESTNGIISGEFTSNNLNDGYDWLTLKTISYDDNKKVIIKLSTEKTPDNKDPDNKDPDNKDPDNKDPEGKGEEGKGEEGKGEEGKGEEGKGEEGKGEEGR